MPSLIFESKARIMVPHLVGLQQLHRTDMIMARLPPLLGRLLALPTNIKHYPKRETTRQSFVKIILMDKL